MIEGVANGYKKELEINGIGYRAEKKGNALSMKIGFSHDVVMPEIDGITIEVPSPNKVIISGPDKQKVGQFAAEVREHRPPEPYKGKGIRYVDEYVRRKEGKAGKGK
jgi:large subunit ribosomal protein L6